MLSEAGWGRGGPGTGEICLVRPGERVTNHIHALSLVPVKSVSFSSSALANSILVSQWPFPGKGMPRASGQGWPFYQASPPLKINAPGLGWRNQPLMGSWGDWRVLNNTGDQSFPDEILLSYRYMLRPSP